MNILLTGGAGFIGSHTAAELLNAGHDVVVAVYKRQRYGYGRYVRYGCCFAGGVSG